MVEAEDELRETVHISIGVVQDVAEEVNENRKL